MINRRRVLQRSAGMLALRSMGLAADADASTFGRLPDEQQRTEMLRVFQTL